MTEQEQAICRAETIQVFADEIRTSKKTALRLALTCLLSYERKGGFFNLCKEEQVKRSVCEMVLTDFERFEAEAATL